MKSRKLNNSKLNCCRFLVSKISCGCIKTNTFIEKFENIDNFRDDNKPHVDSGNTIWHFNLDDIDIPFIDDDGDNYMTGIFNFPLWKKKIPSIERSHITKNIDI